MGEQLRLQILVVLDKHHKSGAANLKEDVEIAHELNRPVNEIQDQLDILESQKLANLYKSMGPSYAADITAEGLLFLEQVKSYTEEQQRREPVLKAKPSMAKLSGVQVEQLQNAILDAFTPDQLRQFLLMRLERDLSRISMGGNLTTVVFDVITAANREGWIGDLLRAVKAERPALPELQSLIGALLAQVQSVDPSPATMPIARFVSPPAIALARPESSRQSLDSADALTLSVTDNEMLRLSRRFRDERLARIKANETPVRIKDEPRVVLHLIPSVAVVGTQRFEMADVAKAEKIMLAPIEQPSWSMRYNLDGFVTYVGYEGVHQDAYLQVFHNGCLESVQTDFVSVPESKLLASEALEREVIFSAVRYQRLFLSLGIEPPLVVSLSLLGVEGHAMALPRDRRFMRSQFPRYDTDRVALPELSIMEYYTDNASAARMLKPLFDTMWQASGLPRSPYYAEDGEWKPSR